MENKENIKPVEGKKSPEQAENRDGKNKQNFRKKNYRYGKKRSGPHQNAENEAAATNDRKKPMQPEERKSPTDNNQQSKQSNNRQGDKPKPRRNKKNRYDRRNRKNTAEGTDGKPITDEIRSGELSNAGIESEKEIFAPDFHMETVTDGDRSEPSFELDENISAGGFGFGSFDLDDLNEEPAEQENEVPVELVEIIGVYFKKSGKVYYFDPSGLKVSRDDHVIVETVRGLEFGYVSVENRMVPAKEIVPPLRKAIRIATEEDESIRKKNEQKEIEAFNICLTKIEEHKLDMKLVEVEYTFDNSKLLFYFTSEGRVDFRELVKDLATVFRTRIELRQIGIRDEAKMMGGLGICGRPFCCKTFLPDFVQVSIKMAKEQNISLNSTKISGACNRLMCCLRYEYDTYLAEAALTPKVGAEVLTPDGEGVVTETTPINGIVKVTLKQSPEKPPQIYHRDDLKQVIKEKDTK